MTDYPVNNDWQCPIMPKLSPAQSVASNTYNKVQRKQIKIILVVSGKKQRLHQYIHTGGRISGGSDLEKSSKCPWAAFSCNKISPKKVHELTLRLIEIKAFFILLGNIICFRVFLERNAQPNLFTQFRIPKMLKQIYLNFWKIVIIIP